MKISSVFIRQCVAALVMGSFTALPAFAGLDSLLPPKLTNAKGAEVSRDQLKGKIVGLYFSASWCPPCRAFTPELVKFRDANAEDFEVVLIGADRSADAQKKYMVDYQMTWPALPFGSSEKEALSKKFGISGIPALVIVDDQGNLITDKGRADVSRNADGALKAWQAKAKS